MQRRDLYSDAKNVVLCSYNFKNDEDEFRLEKEHCYEIRDEVLQQIHMLPYFPSFELISSLSRENYERKGCTAKLIFFPPNMQKNGIKCSFVFKGEKKYFVEEKQRLIRKILESLDKQHMLVLKYDSKKSQYYAYGIAPTTKLCNCSNYYYVSISGYLKWSAQCRNFDLFDYDAGKFYSYNHIEIVTERQLDKVMMKCVKKFPAINKNLINLLRNLNDLGRGVAIVIFASEEAATSERNRLCNANRGFAANKKLSYEALENCLSQFTKVDGGLLLDANLNCYAYGCIYDGEITVHFKGNLERGSRYNSTALYVKCMENISKPCIGIVISDDGGIESVSMSKL